MINNSHSAVKNDFIMALRISCREGLSDDFAYFSLRSSEASEMIPRKSVKGPAFESHYFQKSKRKT